VLGDPGYLGDSEWTWNAPCTCGVGMGWPHLEGCRRYNDNDLQGVFDARVWARRFMLMLRSQQGEKARLPVDEGQMLAWFASAIMAGYDHAHKVVVEDAGA
jgi:hypothetical protein